MIFEEDKLPDLKVEEDTEKEESEVLSTTLPASSNNENSSSSEPVFESNCKLANCTKVATQSCINKFFCAISFKHSREGLGNT